jgi:hypothetical protein
MPCPSLAEQSNSTQNAPAAPEIAAILDDSLGNPNPENEHVGIDDEGLYIDVGPQQAPAQQPQPPAQHSSSDDDSSDEEYEVNDDDDDNTVVDPDEMV